VQAWPYLAASAGARQRFPILSSDFAETTVLKEHQLAIRSKPHGAGVVFQHRPDTVAPQYSRLGFG